MCGSALDLKADTSVVVSALILLGLFGGGPSKVRPEVSVAHPAAMTRSLPSTFVLSGSKVTPGPVCRTCGTGIPDAPIARGVSLGGDSSRIFADRLRVYVKVVRPAGKEIQLSLDVDQGSSVFLVGSRF